MQTAKRSQSISSLIEKELTVSEKKHVGSFNLHSKLKKIPNGNMIVNIKKGLYKDYIKEKDWAIVYENGTKKYYEILKVNSHTLEIEKEKIVDNRILRYSCLIKKIVGIISI